MKNFDQYYDPPDEEELPCCEECGHEMTVKKVWQTWNRFPNDYSCEYTFCPAKFSGVVKEMAEEFVEAKDVIKQLERRVKFLTRVIKTYDQNWDK